MPSRVLFLLLAGLAVSYAQQGCSNNGSLAVSGQGTASAAPDVAKVFVTATSTKPTAKEAREEAAAATKAIVDAVSAIPGVNKDDITTLDISLQQETAWDEEKQRNNVTGYTFTQRLQVKILNITNDLLGSVVDTAVEAGGDNARIESVQVELSPELQLATLNVAREDAVADAKGAADVLAKAAGVTLGAIKSFSEGSVVVPGPNPVPSVADAKGAGTTQTQVNIGSTDVTTTVSMAFEFCNP